MGIKTKNPNPIDESIGFPAGGSFVTLPFIGFLVIGLGLYGSKKR